MATFTAHATGYHKKADGDTNYNAALEGGNKDRVGRELHSIEDYFRGKGSYVAIAIDTTAEMKKNFPYGTKIKIQFSDETRERLAKKYGVSLEQIDSIDFRLVDTGSAFKNKGTGRLDICSGYSNKSDSEVTGKIQWQVAGSPDAALLKNFKGSSATHDPVTNTTTYVVEKAISIANVLFPQKAAEKTGVTQTDKGDMQRPEALRESKLTVTRKNDIAVDEVRKTNVKASREKPEATHQHAVTIKPQKNLAELLVEQLETTPKK